MLILKQRRVQRGLGAKASAANIQRNSLGVRWDQRGFLETYACLDGGRAQSHDFRSKMLCMYFPCFARLTHKSCYQACHLHAGFKGSGSMAAAQDPESHPQGTAGPRDRFPEIVQSSPPSPQLLSHRSGGLPPLHGMRQNMRSKSSSSLFSSFLHRTHSTNEYAPSYTTNGDDSVSGHESPLSLHSLDATRARAVTDTGGREYTAGNDKLYTVCPV